MRFLLPCRTFCTVGVLSALRSLPLPALIAVLPVTGIIRLDCKRRLTHTTEHGFWFYIPAFRLVFLILIEHKLYQLCLFQTADALHATRFCNFL